MTKLFLAPSMKRRVETPELMDRPDSDLRLLHNTLGQFGLINRWLAGVRHILKRHIVQAMQEAPQRQYHLVDLGAGACETMVWLLEHCRKNNLRLRVTACDHDSRVVAFARDRYGQVAGLDIRECDVMAIDDLKPVDFFFANHFLHHLDDQQIIELLQYLSGFAEATVLISDLRRSRLAYATFYLAGAPLFPRSFARHDGLLSIRKGFKPDELQALVQAASGSEGSRYYQVAQRFPARVVLTRSALVR